LIAGPVLLIGQQVFAELASLYRTLNLQNLGHPGEIISRLPEPLKQLAITFNADIHSWISQLTARAFNSLSGLLSSLGWFAGSLVVIAFSTFFLLRDGDKIKKLVEDLLPLSSKNEGILFDKINHAVSGVFKGQFLIALTQAFASLFGVPKALLWGCMVFLAAFVPTFGTGLVLVPAVIYLYLTGHTGAAIGQAIWGAACVGLIDNVLSAKVVASRVRLHPLLTIFSI